MSIKMEIKRPPNENPLKGLVGGNPEEDLRKIALNTIAVISERVQNQGKKTDNTRIRTKAEKKTGAYSKYYGKKRQKKGYQTSIIDLTVTGDLISRGLTAAPLNKNEWVVGFNDKQGVKADGLEDYFGTIFQLSDKEIQLVTKI